MFRNKNTAPGGSIYNSFNNNLQHASWKVKLLYSKNAFTIQNQAICFKD